MIDFGLVDEAVDDTTHVVSLRGEIDAMTAPKLGSRLFGLADEGKRGVVVDLSEVTFMDSTGIGVLLNALRHFTTRHQKMVLVCPTARVLRPFEVTGLVGHLTIFELTREGARRARLSQPQAPGFSLQYSSKRSAGLSRGRRGVALRACPWERCPTAAGSPSEASRCRDRPSSACVSVCSARAEPPRCSGGTGRAAGASSASARRRRRSRPALPRAAAPQAGPGSSALDGRKAAAAVWAVVQVVLDELLERAPA